MSEGSFSVRADKLTSKKRKEGEKIAKKSLSKREKLFCLNYAVQPDGRDAAIKAGYALAPATAAVKLLSRRDIRDEIASLTQAQSPCRNEAAAGYRKLAFGSIADAVSLIYRENPPTESELAEMELFNVSEIKRPKGGGIEIKFFDRLKALDRLAEMTADQATDTALPFYRALENSANAIRKSDADE